MEFAALLRVDLQGSFLRFSRGHETVAGWRRAKGWIGRLLSQVRIRPCHLGGVWPLSDLAWQGPKVTQVARPSQERICKRNGKEIQREGGRVGWDDLAVLGPKVRGGGKPQQATEEEPEHTTNNFSPPPSKPSKLPNPGEKLYPTIDIRTLPNYVCDSRTIV